MGIKTKYKCIKEPRGMGFILGNAYTFNKQEYNPHDGVLYQVIDDMGEYREVDSKWLGWYFEEVK